ncbi:MAG: hypothetical protein H6707_06345 [Deltaproteobacteria bacterium]|nr:hypothetical protein [Deltaproteobacteria bacterium]
MLTTEQMLSTYQPIAGDYRLQVGFEYEVQCFRRSESLRPLRYQELLELLETIAVWCDGTLAPGDPVSKLPLAKGALISLEPGGQLEYSSAPVERFADAIAQHAFFVEILERLERECDVHVFFGGLNPVHRVSEIGLVLATGRYRIMDEYFPRVGTMGRRMMRQSCSVQVTFDYQDPGLGVELLRTAFLLSPFAAALFSNAPFVDGQRSAFLSHRVPIWRNTDPSRTGLPPGFCDADYDFSDYLRFVLDAPMFFVNTESGLVDADGLTFEQFNRQGYRGRAATLEDFELHNSTIFTDARLKRTVEVRSVDGQDPALVPAVLAFLSGLLLCQAARRETLSTLSTIDCAEYEAFPERFGRRGMETEINGRNCRELLLELIDRAANGLYSCFADGDLAAQYLKRVRELCERGQTPANVVLDRFGDANGWLRAGRTFREWAPASS